MVRNILRIFLIIGFFLVLLAGSLLSFTNREDHIKELPNIQQEYLLDNLKLIPQQYPTEILNVATEEDEEEIWVIYFNEFEMAQIARDAVLEFY